MTRINRTLATMAAVGLAAILVGCGQQSADKPAASASIYAAALASEARPEGDRARDAGRKPAEVLEFMGIEPGMTVLDMFTGSGYYAEILSGVVGDEGKVIAQSNQAYLAFVGDAFEERFGKTGNFQTAPGAAWDAAAGPAQACSTSFTLPASWVRLNGLGRKLTLGVASSRFWNDSSA